MYLEVIGVLHYNNHDGVIHVCVLKACVSSKYSKCISVIKRILYTIAMYISSSSFVYLCLFLFTAMHVKSLALCVACGSEDVTHNTIDWEFNPMLYGLWQACPTFLVLQAIFT